MLVLTSILYILIDCCVLCCAIFQKGFAHLALLHLTSLMTSISMEPSGTRVLTPWMNVTQLVLPSQRLIALALISLAVTSAGSIARTLMITNSKGILNLTIMIENHVVSDTERSQWGGCAACCTCTLVH